MDEKPAVDCKFLDCIWHQYCWNKRFTSQDYNPEWNDVKENLHRCDGEEKCEWFVKKD